jgi:hypothetical protein
MSKPHMTPVSNLHSWLTMAAQIYPPQQVALVGAGNGTGPLVQWLQSWASDAGQGLPAVTLLEPHAPSRAQLSKRLASQANTEHWQLLPDILTPVEGKCTYYQYTLASENGLMPPDDLHTLWPSLQLQSQEHAATVALAQLLPAGWLLLDCLPAAHLLQGAPLPDSTQVVLARVVLSDAAPAGSSLANVQALLAPSGFKTVATFAERNSGLGKALFVRAPSSLQEKIEQLAQAKEAETAAKLVEVKAKAELQSQLDQVGKSLQTEKTLLFKEKSELVLAKEKLERLTNERQTKIKQLEQKLQLLQNNTKIGEDRCRSLEGELLKAEAQIELIKSFVLQGSNQ